MQNCQTTTESLSQTFHSFPSVIKTVTIDSKFDRSLLLVDIDLVPELSNAKLESDSKTEFDVQNSDDHSEENWIFEWNTLLLKSALRLIVLS